MNCERWTVVAGHSHYQVSDFGRVRSADRLVRCGPSNGFRRIAGRLLKPTLVQTGYLQVDLNRVRHSVHRLVAAAWCDGYFDGAVVDHLNGDKTDNRASNLEWVTQAENIRRGNAYEARIWKGKFSSEHPTSKPVISTCVLTGREVFWPSAMDAVRKGFRSDSISRACRGLIAHHKGHFWRFAEPHPDERAA